MFANWREHWFVVNVLQEIPILGSFFKEKDVHAALHDAGKCAASVAAGTLGMRYVYGAEENMVGGMVLGMTAGKILYNGVTNGVPLLFSYIKTAPVPAPTNVQELQAINLEEDSTILNSPRSTSANNLR